MQALPAVSDKRAIIKKIMPINQRVSQDKDDSNFLPQDTSQLINPMLF